MSFAFPLPAPSRLGLFSAAFPQPPLTSTVVAAPAVVGYLRPLYKTGPCVYQSSAADMSLAFLLFLCSILVSH